MVHTLDGKRELFAFSIPFDKWLDANPDAPSNHPQVTPVAGYRFRRSAAVGFRRFALKFPATCADSIFGPVSQLEIVSLHLNSGSRTAMSRT